MQNKQILIVAAEATRLSTLKTWKEEPAVHSVMVSSDEEAIEKAHQQNFDLVVVENGAEGIDVQKLGAVMPILQENVAFLHFQSETAEELQQRVAQYFDQRKASRIRNILVLDSSREWDGWTNLPAFSAN
jgi:DNA-binding response OmpR family regulator